MAPRNLRIPCGKVDTDCCNDVPSLLKASVSNTQDCGCADGVEFTLDHDGERWVGSFALPDCHNEGPYSLEVWCENVAGVDTWLYDVTGGGVCGFSREDDPMASSSCDPFELVTEELGPAECCSGPDGTQEDSITITITPA